jgi:hypothetical protein
MYNIRSKEAVFLSYKINNKRKYLTYSFLKYIKNSWGYRAFNQELNGNPFNSKYVKEIYDEEVPVIKNKYLKFRINKKGLKKKKYIRLKKNLKDTTLSVYETDSYEERSNLAKLGYQLDTIFNMELNRGITSKGYGMFLRDIFKFRDVHKGKASFKIKGRKTLIKNRFKRFTTIIDLLKPWLKPFNTKSKSWRAYIDNFEMKEKEHWVKKQFLLEKQIVDSVKLNRKISSWKPRIEYIALNFKDFLNLNLNLKDWSYIEIPIWQKVRERVLKDKKEVLNLKENYYFSKWIKDMKPNYYYKTVRKVAEASEEKFLDNTQIFITGFNYTWEQEPCFPKQLPTIAVQKKLKPLNSYLDIFNWEFIISKFVNKKYKKYNISDGFCNNTYIYKVKYFKGEWVKKSTKNNLEKWIDNCNNALIYKNLTFEGVLNWKYNQIEKEEDEKEEKKEKEKESKDLFLKKKVLEKSKPKPKSKSKQKNEYLKIYSYDRFVNFVKNQNKWKTQNKNSDF